MSAGAGEVEKPLDLEVRMKLLERQLEAQEKVMIAQIKTAVHEAFKPFADRQEGDFKDLEGKLLKAIGDRTVDWEQKELPKAVEKNLSERDRISRERRRKTIDTIKNWAIGIIIFISLIKMFVGDTSLFEVLGNIRLL